MNSRTIRMPALTGLSFPDFAVLDFNLDHEARRLKIEMEGAWLDVDGGERITQGTLIIEKWSGISASQYNHDRWTEVEDIDKEPLKDICEAEFLPMITLSGFSANSGLWTRYVVHDATTRYVAGSANGEAPPY